MRTIGKNVLRYQGKFCVWRKKKVMLCEYAEETLNKPLSIYQKQFLETVEKNLKNGYEISVIMPMRAGRAMFMNIINEWQRKYKTEVDFN